MSPNVFAVARAGWSLDERALALLCSTLFLWVAWFALVRSTYLASVVMLPAVLFVPVEMHLLANYDARLTSATWGVIFESNIREATEFLRALDGASIGACGLLLALAIACLRAIARSRLQWRHRSRYWILIAVAFTLLGFHLAFERQNAELGAAPMVEAFFVNDGAPAVLATVGEAFPLSLAMGIEQYVAHRRALEQQTAKLRQAPPFSAHQAVGAGHRQTYVLVVGETGRADCWGLNGHHRPTSPRLSAQSMCNL